MQEKKTNWQKVVTREFSFLWASYTAEVYRSMLELTGASLKDNLFYTEGRILTIYREPTDVDNSYNLIDQIVKYDSGRVVDNMDKFESSYAEVRKIMEEILRHSMNGDELRQQLLLLSKEFQKTISYYLFAVFLGYAANSSAIKNFLIHHGEQFERIRMCKMDNDFHFGLPKVFSLLKPDLGDSVLYMSYDELLDFLNQKKVDWKKVTERHGKALLIEKNNISKEYPLSEISAILERELAHIQINKSSGMVRGTVCQRGIAKGRVVKLFASSDYIKITGGDVVIIPMTKPDIVPYIKRASAIVTNDGGALSHASIISRELGIPCIVGTKYATDMFEDGDMVEVDANSGVVRKI